MTAKKPTKMRTKGAKKTSAKKSAPASVTATNIRDAQANNQLIERKGIGLWDPAAMVCTVLSVGRIPFAPGTWGSLVGVVFFPLFPIALMRVGMDTEHFNKLAVMVLALLVLLYSIGVIAVKSYQTKTKTSDAPEIVYDEFFGQILTYTIAYGALFIIIGKEGTGVVTQTQALIYEFVPFLFFRLFDICKPWPINMVDKVENSAWGVMFDDVVAAFYAAAASVIVFLVLDNYIVL